jgi:putative transposase
MKLFKNKYRVESSRLKDWDYSTPAWYYITICIKNMKCWFGEIKNGKVILNKIGKLVKDEWMRTKELRENVDLDYFIVMPNHLHGIIIINGSEIKRNVEPHRDAALQIVRNNLSDIIRGFKGSCTRQIHININRSFAWQAKFYDHIIRNELDLFRIRNYIQNNPLKWEMNEYYTA